MNQREFVSASIKLLGFVIMLYGFVALLGNIQGYVGAKCESQSQLWCSKDIPPNIKQELEQDDAAGQRAQEVVAVLHLSKIPRNILILLLGLLFCKKDGPFVSFLLGKNNANVQAR